jgi:hypothetical protein
MKQHAKKCMLGFSEKRRILNAKGRSKKDLERITDLVHPSKKDGKIVCTCNPPLSKSDREDLGYHYKKGKLYNLNYAEVPSCIFCKFYE